MTELGLLAQQIGVDERTLRRAVNQKTLRGSRRSPRTLELSLSEQHYIRRSWHLLAGLRTALRTEHNVSFALLFGSAATGMDTPTSDVDVLVALRDGSLDRLLDLGGKLSAKMDRRGDLVRLQDAEGEPSFLAAVLAEGRVLVDRAELWPRLRSRQATPRGPEPQPLRAEAALAGIDRLLAVRA